MARGAWDFSRKGRKPRGSGFPLKAINARYPLEDWKLIRKAAADAGQTMTQWLIDAAEPSVRKLRREAAQADA